MNARQKKKFKEELDRRWSAGEPHDPRSTALFETLREIDVDEELAWECGGDGDNGETLMWQLDVHFWMQDRKKTKEIL